MESPTKKTKFKEGYGNVDKNVTTDLSAFVFDYDMSHPPDPVHKYEIRKWSPLIVDKADIEKTVESILEKTVEKVLKKICSESLRSTSSEDLEVFTDRLIEQQGKTFF